MISFIFTLTSSFDLLDVKTQNEKDVVSTHNLINSLINQLNMKLASFLALSSLSSAAAFAPSAGPARSFALKNQLGNNMDTSGNSWKPDSEKMVRSFFVGNVYS